MEKVEVEDSGSLDSQREIDVGQIGQIGQKAKRLSKFTKFQLLLICFLTAVTVTLIIKLIAANQRLHQLQSQFQVSEQQLLRAQQQIISNNQEILKQKIDAKLTQQKVNEYALKSMKNQEKLKDWQNAKQKMAQRIRQQMQAKLQKINEQWDAKNKQLKSNVEKYQKQNKALKEQLQQNSQKIVKLSAAIQSINKTEERQLKQKLPFEKQFSESAHSLKFHPSYKWYNRNHAHYLSKMNASRVLQINCTSECKQSYSKDEDSKQLNATFYDAISHKKHNDSYDWIIIRYNVSNKKQAFIFTQKFAKFANKGLTLMFNNLNEYRQFKAYYLGMVEELMKFYGFQYDEMISLNLRRREGKVLLVYSSQVKRSTFPFKKPAKNQIAIQFEIKFNENIPYMRQWIGYHIYMGVDKFFIYDNNGSLGEINKSNTTTNKYGLAFNCLNYTEQQIIEQWDDVWEQFYQHIIYIPWQYLDAKGKITYAQMEGMADYINNFQDTTAYVGFIDADQTLFSENHLNFPDFLTQKSVEGFTRVRLRQKKFLTRFCAPNSRVLDINYTFQVNTVGWAQKLFFETQQFYPGLSPHTGKTFTGKQFIVNNDKDWRFNHYNLIERMIGYSHTVRNSTSTKLSYDNSGKQYKQVMDKICDGKCSQKFAVICQLNNPLFSCPIDGKQYPVPPPKPKKQNKAQTKNMQKSTNPSASKNNAKN